jgi:lipopolysaccharide export system protein LptA
VRDDCRWEPDGGFPRDENRRGGLTSLIGCCFVISCWWGLFIPVSAMGEDIDFSLPSAHYSIAGSADSIMIWPQGQYEMLHLAGSVRLQQGNLTATSDEAILWVEKNNELDDHPRKVIVYLEGQVVLERQHPRGFYGEEASASSGVDRMVDERWLGRLLTSATLDLDRRIEPLGERAPPAIFQRSVAALEAGTHSSIALASGSEVVASNQQPYVVSPHTGGIQQVPDSQAAPPFGTVVPDGSRNVDLRRPAQADPQFQSPARSPFRVQINGRDGGSLPNAKIFTNPENPNEQIALGTGGFRITIDSPAISQMQAFRSDKEREVVLVADNMVQWQVSYPDGSVSRQFYLEGNVIFAKDRRVINADKMFYDIENQRGTILDVDMLTPVQSYQGLVRLKAGIIQQVDENNVQAYGAAMTSSRMGVPRYWLQSGNIALNRVDVPAFDPQTGLPAFDYATGQAVAEDEYWVEAQRNRVYLAGVPVLAWPRFRTSLNNPDLYLQRFSINNDRIFGTQVRTGWDLNQIFGRPRVPGREGQWIGVLDYLSERGLGYGTERTYRQDSFFGIPGEVSGQLNTWFIRDSGLDFLGRGRFNLLPETRNRGKAIGRHRHRFESGWLLRGELGYISDRNFLEQFYEREWDRRKDATTGIWLEQNLGSQSFNLLADYQINDFFTQTSWLPRFDHFLLGQSLLADRAVWHGRTHIGYGRMRVASTPLNPSEQAVFDPLAWEAKVQGVRMGTRQELDFPVQLGPVKLVPYVLGDVTFWQQDLMQNDVTRIYGQTGIRASLPFWKVNPMIQSDLLNVNGLAHKVSFEMEALIADSSQDLSRFPLYDQLDDDAQEHFRRRFAFQTFGIAPGEDIPLQFDERYFALRSGMQRFVTAPSMEIADDLALIRFGARQRWQTKRGLTGRERIVDWITLDTHTTLFPNSNRDNFGSSLGLFDYDFNWYVGDRFAIVSDGFLDFFSQGLRTVSLGGRYGRPEVGTLNLKYRMIEGPISSNLVSLFSNYRMSEKWGFMVGGQLDLGSTGRIAQFLDVVYIGESFLWQFGGNYDFGRDNLGIRFGFEPRFSPTPRVFRPGGTPIPPASSLYLE